MNRYFRFHLGESIFERVGVNSIYLDTIEVPFAAHVPNECGERLLGFAIEGKNFCFSADPIGELSKIKLRNKMMICLGCQYELTFPATRT